MTKLSLGISQIYLSAHQ